MPKKGKAALKKKQKKQGQKKNNSKQSQNQNAKLQQNKLDNDNNNPDLIALDDEFIKEFRRDIHIQRFSVAPIGGGPLLVQRADLKLIHGHRYGLIGYNGTGKTTMLKDIASGDHKEIPDYLKVLHVHQELEGDTRSVLETVLQAHTERVALLKEEERLRNEMELFENNQNNDQSQINNNINNGNVNANGTNVTNETNETTTNTSDEFINVITESSAADVINTNNNEINESNGNSVTILNEEKIDNNDDFLLDHTDRLHLIEERLKAIGSSTAPARASSVLSGLGFTDRMKNMKTLDLSGGWRMRVSLGIALFIEPDLLLLDEPTNHLDFPSVIWLSEYLTCDYPMDKTIVIVSHDRRFLNDVCTDIMHLYRTRLLTYKGNYDSFLEVRKQMRSHQSKQYEKQQKMIRHNEDFVARFKANKKWSTQAQSRNKMLSKLNRIEKVLSDLEFRFQFPQPPPLKNPKIFELTKVSFGYFGEDSSEKSYLLKKLNLRLEFGNKVAIMGANGAGKSTLLRLIMNELQPIEGTCYLSNAVEVGYFAQHHLETLDYNATPLEHLKNVFGNATLQEIYAQLGKFSLGDQFARQKIGTLSGGQKSRVAFSILTWYSPHLIIMDEPTNHLDLPTIDALAIALSDYNGSVLIVSHDQHFVETVCDEYWAVGNRDIKVFDNFQKCRKYSHNKCKPIDVLPRQFSSVVVKEKYNKKRNLGRIKAAGSSISNSNETKEDDLKLNNNINNGISKPIVSKKTDVFEIDAEREIDKGIEKGLSPNQILKHMKGWKPIDGDINIINKLGFIMFHDYFDEIYKDCEINQFFEKWKSLIIYVLPINHNKNQMQLIDVSHACWKTANKDNNFKTKQSYSFGRIIEIMTKKSMITMECVGLWEEKNKNKIKNKIKKEIATYKEAMLEEDENDSDSDESD